MILTRFAAFEDRVLGRLDLVGSMWWTIERPWLLNEPNVSCIPEGTYPMLRTDSPRFGPNMWEITVPGRTHILIHVANTAKDIKGCIGLGKGLYGDLAGVANSRAAIDEFYSLTTDANEMEIEIVSGVIE